jgi:hypothetical protein
VGGLVLNALTPTPYAYGFGQSIDGIIKDLAKRIRVRGDANYCVCRILLETLKPVSGWSYHSLSDTVMACDAAISLVYDTQREQKLEDVEVADAISVLGDVVTEIERRLLGPYEDTAILKNGDLACFANESFALKPLGLGLGLGFISGANSGRVPCGCKCDPGGCSPGGCEPEATPLHCELGLLGIDDHMPPITKALTQEQYDSVDKERRSDD